MSYTDVQICNFAGGKLGGFGDQVSASGEIANLTATDPVTVACAREWPKARKQVIIDLALMRAPVKETVKLAELDTDLTDEDDIISSISVGAGPGYTVTITTKTVHGRSTGDTVVLKGIDGTGGVGSLNGTTYTITVLTTTTFTLDSTTGSSSWSYTTDSGIVSDAPELGPWTYAFDVPSTSIAVVRVLDEQYTTDEDTRKEYQFDLMLNRDSDGLIIVTNDLTNADGDGIYVQYAIDQSTPTLFKLPVVEAIATLLASQLAPTVGRNTQVRYDFLKEYKKIALPDAAAYNNSQSNTRAKARKDFRGGRIATLPTGI
jgi:hypothetical protein